MNSKQEVTYYNTIHSTIGACKGFLPLIGATAVGGIIAGTVGVSAVYGAGIGFTLGGIDLAAKLFEIYERPYLTWAVLGAGVLSKLSLPYYMAPIAGFVGGLFIPTGMLNDHLDKAVAPILGALYGYSYVGNYGTYVGFAAGVIDKSLHSFDITSQYYLTTMVQDVAISNLMLPIIPNAINLLPMKLGIVRSALLATTKSIVGAKYAKEAIGSVYGAYEAYRAEKPGKWAPMKLAKDMYEIYADIIDEKQLQEAIDHHAIPVVAASLVTQTMLVSLAEYQQNLRHSFEHFSIDSQGAWIGFLEHFLSFAIFIPPYVAGFSITNIINDFFSITLRYIITDLLTHKLTEGETVLKLINSNNGNNTDANTLIKRKYGDITSLTAQGTHLMVDALSSVVKGIFAINYLVSVNAQDMLIYSMFYNDITKSLSDWLSKKVGSYDVDIIKFIDQKTSLEEYLRVNADAIIQRESNDFIRSQLFKIDHSLRSVAGEQTTWTTLRNIWTTAQSTNNFLVSYFITAYYLSLGVIDFDVRFKVIYMNDAVSPMLAWSEGNAGAIVTVEQAMDRLNELKARMKDLTSDSRTLPTYSYQLTEEQSSWMCFDDLTVRAGDKTLMHVDHQCVDENRIAVTGESHSGKSTLLKLVKGLKHSVAWGNGKITFYTENGEAPTVIMASQHYNMPPYVNLLELITLKPYDEAKRMEDQVKSLMNEIGIDSDKNTGEVNLISLLDEEKDWDQYITSGGARKKLMAIWVILQKPDIAILDEIFVGIDRDAILKIQKMFKKYLPDTKFLIVDHEASTHNFDGFYQQNIHVENKAIHLQVLPVTHSDQDIEPVQEVIELSKDDHADICPLLGNASLVLDNPMPLT